MPPKGKGDMKISDKVNHLRGKNKELWMEFSKIIQERSKAEYDKIMGAIEQMEIEIGWVAEDLASKECIYDNGYRANCLTWLKKLREENNALWMKLIEKAYDIDPERSRTIMTEIAHNDSIILKFRLKERKNEATKT